MIRYSFLRGNCFVLDYYNPLYGYKVFDISKADENLNRQRSRKEESVMISNEMNSSAQFSSFRFILRLAGVVGVALLTANCATTDKGSRIDPKYGVAASPKDYDENQAIPKGGGRYQTGKPYHIAGRMYVPISDPAGYAAEGIASWYGPGFHGRKTANGEYFDQNSLTAAHPTLPLPSYVRVTNLNNNHSVIVRVNDRGPFAHDRVIDLSQKTADVLRFRQNGTAQVRVEYVGRASTNGSDDNLLLASLTTNGQPAQLKTAPQAVMVAELAPEENRYSPVVKNAENPYSKYGRALSYSGQNNVNDRIGLSSSSELRFSNNNDFFPEADNTFSVPLPPERTVASAVNLF